MFYKRNILILLGCVLGSQAFSQVGIGNVIPDSNAILDLRNTNNKAILLPDIPGIPPSSPTGLMYWDSSLEKVMYRESGGYNALSPWKFKFNGSTSDNLTFNVSGGNFGIGLDDPQRKFHLKENGESFVLEGTSSSYIGFYPNSFSSGSKARIGFTSSSTTLVIEQQNSGADVEVKVSNGGDLNVTGGGRVKEDGQILMPTGIIVMWSGTTAPDGWILCNGSNTFSRDGVTYTTPDLSGKFIVGYGTGDYSNPGNRSQAGSSNGNTGGMEDNTLTENDIPQHTHDYSGSVSGGSHTHTIYYSDKSSGGSPTGDMLWLENTNVSSDGSVSTNNGSSDGSHSHSYSGTTTAYGKASNDAIDNRPPYYVLAFIMKK